MKRKIWLNVITVCIMVLVYLGIPAGIIGWEETLAAASTTIKWDDCLQQSYLWYKSDEALRIADNVLLYQRDTGGWPKNIDMATVLTEEDREVLLFQKVNRGDSTIDNDATIMQLRYLAKVYNASRVESYKEAFIKGLDYLFAAQYENGGWPQFYPLRRGYWDHITFNDNAMVNVLYLLQEVVDEKNYNYAFLDEEYRKKAGEAVRKGIECILGCQIKVDGKLTAWCAQHYADTLEPAPARSYEKISLSGSEGVGVVRFLMSIENPAPEVIEAVQAAVAWFDEAKLTGIVYEKKSDPSFPNGFDYVVYEDPNAPPIWARFYDIDTNTPIFSGRDGIIKYSMAEIEHERRANYRWYTDVPRKLLAEDYLVWQQKWAPDQNVLK